MAEYGLGTAKGKIQVDYDGKGIKQAQDDVKTYRDAQGRLRDEHGKYVKTANDASAATKRFGQATSESAANSRRAAQQFTAMGAATTLAVAGGFAYATNVAISFEKQISAIGAVSGATKDDLEKLRKKALQIGADTSFSATQSAMAMEELAKAGVSIPDIMNGAADATVALAAAGGIELPKAATIAADAMAQFRLEARELPKIADLFAGAANASSIGVEQLAESMKFVGPVAAAAGLGIQEVTVAIALLGKNGIKGSEAGTALRTMLLNLQPASKPAAKAMKDLGLITADGANKFFDAQGKIKPLPEILKTLTEATKNLTPQQRLLALETIFGKEALSGVASLLAEGTQGYEDMAKAMGKVTAADVAKARLDNVAGAIERMKGSIETASIIIGTMFLPVIKGIATGLDGLAGKFNDLSPKTQKTIADVALLVGGMAALVTVLAAARYAVIALDIASVMNPAVITILAVVAVVGGLVIAFKKAWESSEEFRNKVTAGLNQVKAILAEAKKSFDENIAPPLRQARDVIVNELLPAFESFRAKLIDDILPPAKEFATLVKEKVGPFLKEVGTIIKEQVVPALKDLSAWWKENKADLEPILLDIGKFLVLALLASAAVGVLIAGFSALAGIKTVAFVFQLITAQLEFMVFQFQWAKTIVMAFIEVLGWLISKAGDVRNFVIMAIGGMALSVIASFNNIKSSATDAFNYVQNIIRSVMGAIGSYVIGIWNSIVGTFNSARNQISAAANGIGAIVGQIRNFFSQLPAAASGGINSLVSLVAGLPGRVIGAIGDLGGRLYSAGLDLIQGLINGIEAKAGELLGTASSIASRVASVIKGALHIGSPSKLMIQYGKWTGEGLEIGLLSQQKAIETAAKAAANAVLGGFSRLPRDYSAEVRAASLGTSVPARMMGADGAVGGTIYNVKVDVDAPQNMNPDDVGTAVARRIGLGLAGASATSGAGGI